MKQGITTSSDDNRRRARRCQINTAARAECRKGALGLGRNLAIAVLDISETGARLLLLAPLAPGEEVEIRISGTGISKPLKHLGRVVWSIFVADGTHATGVAFDKPLAYANLHRFAKV